MSEPGLQHKSPTRNKLDLIGIGFTVQEAEYLKTLHWQMVFHMSAADGHTLNHAVEALGIVRSTFTPKKSRHKDDPYGEFGTPEVGYFVEDEKEPFATMAEALTCVRKKYHERIVKAMKDAGFKPSAARACESSQSE